jgi:hypothetical protein
MQGLRLQDGSPLSVDKQLCGPTQLQVLSAVHHLRNDCFSHSLSPYGLKLLFPPHCQKLEISDERKELQLWLPSVSCCICRRGAIFDVYMGVVARVD